MSRSTFQFVLLAVCFPFVAVSDEKMVSSQEFDGGAMDDAATEEIAAAAKKIGLDGRWIVLSVDNDGELTNAQIGQEPNDVISIAHGEDRGALEFG